MSGIFRIGTVSDTDQKKQLVRVHFPDVNIVSGWLKIIKSPPSVSITFDSSEIPKAYEPKIEITPWFPKVGETVLCAYNPGFNEDGYVLGVMK
ncbi:MAG: hypothetical protein J1F28_04530 [Oscillospiraceae bacterium]|nr:hypothetical protein [Oscillospiraceae bacterium]